MERKKSFLDDEDIEEEDFDVYDEEGIELSKENDEMSDEEAGFMNGYINGEKSEET